MVLHNVTIPVQPSGPALMLGGCRAGWELRPCSVSSVDGSFGQWVPGWFLLWWRGLCFLLDRIAVHVQQVHSPEWEFSLGIALLYPGLESHGILTSVGS